MILTNHDLSKLLAALKAGEMTETIRTTLAWTLQARIEAEVTAVIGAGPPRAQETRTTQRNGHHPKRVSTQAGDNELAIPKLRTGSFFPSPSSGAAASTGRSTPGPWRPMSRVSPPARSTTRWPASGSPRGSRNAR